MMKRKAPGGDQGLCRNGVEGTYSDDECDTDT